MIVITCTDKLFALTTVCALFSANLPIPTIIFTSSN